MDMIEFLTGLIIELLRQQPEPREDGRFLIADSLDTSDYELVLLSEPGGVLLGLRDNSNSGSGSVEMELRAVVGEADRVLPVAAFTNQGGIDGNSN